MFWLDELRLMLDGVKIRYLYLVESGCYFYWWRLKFLMVFGVVKVILYMNLFLVWVYFLVDVVDLFGVSDLNKLICY